MDKLVIKTLADIETFEQTPIEDRMTCFNTYDLIKQGAAINPEAIAMSFIMSGDAYQEPMQVTYREFVQQINRTANLLHDLLPVDKKINAATVRNHALRVAQRCEDELGEEQVFFIDGCPAEWNTLPPSDGPITINQPGDYVETLEKQGRVVADFEVRRQALADLGHRLRLGLENLGQRRGRAVAAEGFAKQQHTLPRLSAE